MEQEEKTTQSVGTDTPAAPQANAAPQPGTAPQADAGPQPDNAPQANAAPQPGTAPQTEAPLPPRPLRISSPEQVDDYIRVTTPGMWLLVVAMVVLLAALVIWAYTVKIEMKTVQPDGQVTTEYISPSSFLTDGAKAG